MSNKIFDYVTTSFSIVTAAVSIEYIYQVIGIITLVFSIINIIITLSFKIYSLIRQKKLDEIPGSINDAIDELNSLKKEKKDGE